MLRDVSFSVEQGQIAAILGPNGAGKTTTLRAVSGVLRPSGRVTFDGDDIAGKSPEAIARLGIAHVPEGRGTFAGLSVEENLRVGALPAPRPEGVAADIDRCYGTSRACASAAPTPPATSAAASSRCSRWRAG